jgi:hypothetical protein
MCFAVRKFQMLFFRKGIAFVIFYFTYKLFDDDYKACQGSLTLPDSSM